jgi:hypothetical protein
MARRADAGSFSLIGLTALAAQAPFRSRRCGIASIESYGRPSPDRLGLEREDILLSIRWNGGEIAGHVNGEVLWFRNRTRVTSYLERVVNGDPLDDSSLLIPVLSLTVHPNEVAKLYFWRKRDIFSMSQCFTKPQPGSGLAACADACARVLGP